jgi:hypothetical protein
LRIRSRISEGFFSDVIEASEDEIGQEWWMRQVGGMLVPLVVGNHETTMSEMRSAPPHLANIQIV